MKLDLEDGRVILLPDEMADESARQLKYLILGAEERARVAEARCEALAAEMAALRRDFSVLAQRPADNGAVVQAIGQMLEAQKLGVREIVSAVTMDREMVPNEYGDMTRSRVTR